MKQYKLDIILVFKPLKTGSYFSLKSKVPDYLKAGVIYKYTCPMNTDTNYIGKTSRQLCRRIKEHFTPEKNSPVFNHILNCSCSHNHNNFKVLKTARNDYELSVLEALFIKNQKPPLNNTITNNGSSFFLSLF